MLFVCPVNGSDVTENTLRGVTWLFSGVSQRYWRVLPFPNTARVVEAFLANGEENRPSDSACEIILRDLSRQRDGCGSSLSVPNICVIYSWGKHAERYSRLLWAYATTHLLFLTFDILINTHTGRLIKPSSTQSGFPSSLHDLLSTAYWQKHCVQLYAFRERRRMRYRHSDNANAVRVCWLHSDGCQSQAGGMHARDGDECC